MKNKKYKCFDCGECIANMHDDLIVPTELNGKISVCSSCQGYYANHMVLVSHRKFKHYMIRIDYKKP